MQTVFSVMALAPNANHPLFFVTKADSASEAIVSAAVHHANNGFPEAQVVAAFSELDLQTLLAEMTRVKHLT